MSRLLLIGWSSPIGLFITDVALLETHAKSRPHSKLKAGPALQRSYLHCSLHAESRFATTARNGTVVRLGFPRGSSAPVSRPHHALVSLSLQQHCPRPGMPTAFP